MQDNEVFKGIPVRRRNEPSRTGILTGRKQALGPIQMAQVQWGTNKDYTDIRQLEFADMGDDRDIESLVASGRYGTIEDFRRKITYEKLQGTLTDIFYSMQTSQIDFYAHQFKPVIKFIDSPTNRLLIADEVGLGKTIEAGLIWTEWRARHNARRLLVVCPSSLCCKWEFELSSRFQLPAQVLDTKGLVKLMEKFKSHGRGLDFVAVCSYEAISPRKKAKINEKAYFDQLIEGRDVGQIEPEMLSRQSRLLYNVFNDTDFEGFFDLVIFDEAHRMKNTGTIYHTMGNMLSRSCDASLCLSATPIHTKSRDLYALLKLVDPDYFQEEFTFNKLRDGNEPVIKMLNLLSGTSKNIRREELCELSDQICGSRYFADSKIAGQIKVMCESFSGKPNEAANLYHEAEKINLLGSYLNRTRKAQVQERRVQRRAKTLEVQQTEMEKKLYLTVLKRAREYFRSQGHAVTGFHLIAPALRMSSCLPSMIRCLKEGRWGGLDNFEIDELAADYEELFDREEEDAEKIAWQNLSWMDGYDFVKNDSKYKKLLEELIHNISSDEKVIIFAFFKDTIRYLEKRLESDGITAMSVSGDMDRDERNKAINSFIDNECRVLLLSEVGAEGIDLQFCRTMVNYDLPWNPMRVEQRIGRIDRIGQKAEAINIINFYVPDTIDGRIYTLLYERIGIFKSTIGDLESIIGEHISKLTIELLKDELTPDEQERLIDSTCKAIEQRRKNEAELENSNGVLVAFSDYIADRIGDSMRLGRYIKPRELKTFTKDFFKMYPGSNVDWDTPEEGCGKILLSMGAWHSFEKYSERSRESYPAGFNPGRQITVTFDPDVFDKHRRKHPSLVLVNHFNPFIKWMTQELSSSETELYGTSAVVFRTDKHEPGRYFYLVKRLSMEGLRKREKLYYGCCRMSDGEMTIGDAAERVINSCLDSDSVYNLVLDDKPDCSRTMDKLRDEMNSMCERDMNDFKDEIQTKAQVQRQQVINHFDRKISIARMRLENMRTKEGDKARGINLTEKQLASLENRKRIELDKLSDVDSIDKKMNDVCCGIMVVENGK